MAEENATETEKPAGDGLSPLGRRKLEQEGGKVTKVGKPGMAKPRAPRPPRRLRPSANKKKTRRSVNKKKK